MKPIWIILILVAGLLVMGGLMTWMFVWLHRSGKAEEAGIEQRQRDQFPARGWTHTSRDDRATEVFNSLERYPKLVPVVVGIDRSPRAVEAHDVITGQHRGRPFFAALFVINDPLDTSGGGQYGLRQATVWVRTPAPRPTLDVRQVLRMESRINEGLGLGDIKVGHPEFDARYQVTCADEAFARAVLAPAVVDFLLTDPRGCRGFWIRGAQFDAYNATGDHRDPDVLAADLDIRCDLLDRIPRHVWG
ncbi:hypothetical protein [Lentzea flava]|uniref:DUF3137 domain-containing protein n=1 Tax=Lentzea flava TaxID=103732 RepID=A0ABQ2ULD5_9PSEU|nr:hypothetical protein [Lentzea flava]MCP2199649.1 hypothetical protein [Lentzea flava]GGU39275.1 hypothetical protein GCM10010178_34610 [Lentzea flava]